MIAAQTAVFQSHPVPNTTYIMYNHLQSNMDYDNCHSGGEIQEAAEVLLSLKLT
jgi:hypothetical protein